MRVRLRVDGDLVLDSTIKTFKNIMRLNAIENYKVDFRGNSFQIEFYAPPKKTIKRNVKQNLPSAVK